jgi:ribonucleotide monophosphatase NagD (HAD superfamily)
LVIGDIGAAWSYPLMNTIFRQLERGAELVAMHKNRFFQTDEGLSMDIGGFVDGLEFVSGQTAHIVGKPTPAFFQLGIDSIGLDVREWATTLSRMWEEVRGPGYLESW